MFPGKPKTTACSMPPPHAPVQNTNDSETESESDIGVVSELESQPDQAIEYVIENQLGLPQYQHSRSSPPAVDANISCNEFRSSEFFQGVVRKLTLRFAKTAYKVQISGNEGNETMNTDIVLTLSSKVRKTSSVNHYGADLKKLFRKIRNLMFRLKTRTTRIQPSTSTLNKCTSEGKGMSGKLRTLRGRRTFMSR